MYPILQNHIQTHTCQKPTFQHIDHTTQIKHKTPQHYTYTQHITHNTHITTDIFNILKYNTKYNVQHPTHTK